MKQNLETNSSDIHSSLRKLQGYLNSSDSQLEECNRFKVKEAGVEYDEQIEFFNDERIKNVA